VKLPETARTDDHPLVTDGMRRMRGVWDDWGNWSAPIRDSDVRRWAIAVYWPELPPRRFWDETAVSSSSAGGLVVPEEFNPFAWPAPGEASTASSPSRGRDRRPDPQQVRQRVNGGCRTVYGVRMRVGDRIRRRVRLLGWTSVNGTRDRMLFVDYEHEWQNHDHELVRTAVHTLIHW